MVSSLRSTWPVASQRRLAMWRKLATKKGRKQTGQILVEGERLVGEALSSNCEVQHILVADDPQGQAAARRLRLTVPLRSQKTLTVARRAFDQLTDTRHAAGVAAIVAWRPWPFASLSDAKTRIDRILVCDRISDPGNLGTLIRTAAGLGVEAVILHPQAAELTNPKTIRATAGAVFRIPVYENVTPEHAALWLRRDRLTVLIADAHVGDEPESKTKLRRWALVIGGETHPLDPEWERFAARRVRVPLRAGVESLNAAIAGAILIDRLSRSTKR